MTGDLLCNHIFQTFKKVIAQKVTERVRTSDSTLKRVPKSDKQVCHISASGAREQQEYGLDPLSWFPFSGPVKYKLVTVMVGALLVKQIDISNVSMYVYQ